MMHAFRAPMARMGVPSLNHVSLSQNGTWHLPHGGAPVKHQDDGAIFSEIVGAIDALEFIDGQMWAVGECFHPTVADSITNLVVRLSIEITEMHYEMVNGTLYVDGGYIRAALLVHPSKYGWTA